MDSKAIQGALRTRIGRRQFMLLGAGALGAVALSRALPKLSWGARGGGKRWYEVVQDMYRAERWHVNLYSGGALGDLTSGVLEKRWVEKASSADQIVKGLEFPWRVQYSNGPQEQSF